MRLTRLGFGRGQDHFLTRDGRGTVYQCGIGYGVNTPYGENNLDGMREMMTHPCCVIGLADSGAHVGAQTDSCNATYLMVRGHSPALCSCSCYGSCFCSCCCFPDRVSSLSPD